MFAEKAPLPTECNPEDTQPERARSGVPAVFAHSGVLALADQGIVSSTNFLTSLAVARLCGKAELGIYLLAWTVTQMVSEIVTALIITPYNVISPTLSIGEQARYRGSVFLHQFILSAIVSPSLIIAWFYLRRMPTTQQLSGLLCLLSALIFVFVLKEFSRRMFFAHLHMLSVTVADTTACTLQLVLIGIMGFNRSLNAEIAFVVIALASFIPVSAWLLANRTHLVIKCSIAVEDFRRNWDIAGWIVGSGVLWAGAMYAYPWLLIWMCGPSTTGAWAACYGLVALSNPVLLGFGNYLGPKICLLYGQKGVSAMRLYVWRSSLTFALLLAPLGAAAWFLGSDLVRHLYGSAFTGYTIAIRVLAVNVLIQGAVFSFSRGLFSLQRADLDLAVNVIAILLLFLLGVPLVRSFGVTGAAFGLALTNGATALIRAVVFARATRNAIRASSGAKTLCPFSEA